MNTEPELLNERLERLAMVLDEIMPTCALLVRDALELLKENGTVVHCKDCKHILPKGFCHKYSRKVTDDFFCADGERR